MTVNSSSNIFVHGSGNLGTPSILQRFVDLNVDELLTSYSSAFFEILLYYLEHPNQTAYSYCKARGYEISSTEERKAYKNILSLFKKRFIEKVAENPSMHTGQKNTHKKSYRLSINGIIYLILNTTGISDTMYLIKKIQKNYGENILFVFFLYPIITDKSIDEINYDTQFYSIVVKYLKSVCHDMIDAMRLLRGYTNNLSSDDKVMDQVFIYYDNPRDNSEANLEQNIKFFLNNTLKWTNVDSLRIKPKYNELMIEILDANNTSRNSTINITEKEDKAILRQGSKLIHEFYVVQRDGAFIMQAKSKTKIIDKITQSLIERYEFQAISFLVSLTTQIPYSPGLFSNPTYVTLAKDKRYKKALKWLKRKQNLG